MVKKIEAKHGMPVAVEIFNGTKIFKTDEGKFMVVGERVNEFDRIEQARSWIGPRTHDKSEKNAKMESDSMDEKKELEKESKEHPDLPPKTVEKIVEDHEEKKETKQAEEPAPPAEKTEAPKEEVPAEEYDVKGKIENMEKGLAELSEQVSLIREILDKIAEEEEAEAPVTNPGAVKPEVQLEKQEKPEEKKEEKKEEAKMAKDTRYEELDGRFKKLEAEFAKFGVRKTLQSSSVNSDPMDKIADEQLRRRGLL